MNLSERALHAPASAIRKLVPFADKAKKRGLNVYHVNIGQPDLPTPEKIMNFIRSYPASTLEYAPSSGMSETVSAWAVFYKNKGASFSEEDIIVTAGGSEALSFAFFSVADPGDEIIVFEPFYTSYAIIAAMADINLKAITTRVENGFHLPDYKIIEKAISKKTKAIILCNPNNPTGTLYTEREVRLIVDLALKHNLYIISDEPYQEIVFDGLSLLPFSSFKKLLPQLIVTDSVSKRFNSCGARVGCLASKNKQIISASLKFAQARLSVATVDQLAVVPLLKNHSQYVGQVRKTYQSRRDTVIAELKKIPGVSLTPPQGAFYLIPELPINDSDKFAQFLLEKFQDKKETVMVAPATGFYKTAGLGKKEIRIAYVLNEKKLVRAVELLNLALKQYNH
ncbi:hypothetical protein A3D78_01850 [Candidatus Gottesmanbacteria bacterium RIFCSPHIGHO2_02_FULL_39_14]|uniref:Aminotransferase class I/classII large domain-containing protein n=2 Tax=Candidatus Gottesmaniibacteriota TaxID=1752720 RepID=A0A1F6A1K5_9BACT|nr:MAG: hypothetical protein A3D78_01850 [Candidatus Gottesmanbacteria bacterium RIFCSPHIGHO2_02_FULL_39_14]OGG32089.1 MAG: hypothetical protein A3I51_00630 [Candidatus Gottesmanbacteria bacterium RIFCSPLOWO2_02_FULL_38_8]